MPGCCSQIVFESCFLNSKGCHKGGLICSSAFPIIPNTQLKILLKWTIKVLGLVVAKKPHIIKMLRLAFSYSYISRRVAVSCEAMKKQHVRVSSGLHDHYSKLFYTDNSSKFLKCCSSVAITTIT